MTPSSISIARIPIGDCHRVFIVAEISINHNGDPKKARALIDAAAAAGAHAVKLQTYITEKRVAADSPIFGILKKCEIAFDSQKTLFEYGRSKGIVVFSTPFDDESVDFLDSIDCPCYKIASFDIVNGALLQKVCEKGRPVIASRGMANTDEIDTAVELFKKYNVPFALLHCISAYPVPSNADLNLATIAALKERYKCPVGFSDHTLSTETPAFAVATGASIIEKHFTLDQSDGSPDNPVSLDPDQFKRMVEKIHQVHEMIGKPVAGPIAAEKDIMQYRRPS